MKGSVTCGVVVTCETSSSWLATFRGRVGYAFDRWLPYVTGGGAYGNVKATVQRPRSQRFGVQQPARLDRSAPVLNTPSSATGRPSSNISTSISAASMPLPAPAVNNISFKENIVRVGLNYKFSGPIFSRF